MNTVKPHLTYAHQTWESFLNPGDTVIDATVGNGYDTLFLARCLQGSGTLVGYDIQSQAIEETKKRLQQLPEAFTKIITLKLTSHICFDERDVKLIVYNLGYLPGGDKSITTLRQTTLESVKHALSCISTSGAISITCYPRHPEGAKEREALLDFLKTLPKEQWKMHHHVWTNKDLSPSWIWLQSVPRA